jgi:hypothetical protein
MGTKFNEEANQIWHLKIENNDFNTNYFAFDDLSEAVDFISTHQQHSENGCEYSLTKE